jgi:hypothetical protein
MRRNDESFLREIRTAVGLHPARDNFIGALLGLAIVAGFGVMTILILAGGGPAKTVYGQVLGFGLVESDYGSRTVARIWVDDREATVGVPSGQACNVGDRVELRRRNALLGYRYGMGFKGCERVR